MKPNQTHTDGDAIIDYGFDAQGGFYVVNHLRRRATYAYPSSNHATWAKTRPGYVVARMVEEFDDPATPSIHESHYVRVCELIATKSTRTEISKAQALAICGGRKGLLPTPGTEKPQPADASKTYLVGQTKDGKFYTERKGNQQ